MKKTALVLLVIAFIAAVVIYLSFFANVTKVVTVNQNQNGGAVTLKQGDTLTVSLPGNLTTGYTWEALPMDPVILTQTGNAEMTPYSNAIGAGGIINLNFKTVQKGEAKLTLVYHRPWETGVAPISTFEITVTVK